MNDYIQVWFGEHWDHLQGAHTDSAGVAVFSIPATREALHVLSGYYFDCQPFHKGAPRPAFNVEEILSTGVVSENTRGAARLQSHPGELVVFVRRFRFWEGMRL